MIRTTIDGLREMSSAIPSGHGESWDPYDDGADDDDDDENNDVEGDDDDDDD